MILLGVVFVGLVIAMYFKEKEPLKTKDSLKNQKRQLFRTKAGKPISGKFDENVY